MRYFTVLAAALFSTLFLTAQVAFEPLTPFDYATNFRDVHVDPSGNGWAVGTCGVLAGTTDSGQNWEIMTAPDGLDFHAVACAPGTDCQTIFLGVQGFVFRSTDGGDTWTSTEVEHTRAREFHFLDNDVIVLSHDDLGLFRSTDGGDSWTLIPTANSYRGTAHFPTATTGYLFQQSGGPLLKSTDAGATWDSIYQFENNAYYGDWLDENIGYVYTQQNLVLKTTDGGSSWTQINTGTVPGNVRYLAALSETELIAYVFPSNIFRSVDGGMTWQNNTDIGPGLTQFGLRYTGIHRNDNNFWIASWGTEVLYSDDGLETATSQFSVERPSFERMAFPTEQIGYTLRERRGVMKTTDGGDTWTPVLTDFITVSRDFLVLDAETVIVPYNTSGPQITTDGGDTWNPLLPTALQDTLNLFAVEQLPSGRLYLYGSLHAVYSDDDGTTWTPVYHGYGFFPREMVFLNDQTGFVGSDGGRVLATTDGGESWSLVLDGDFTNQPIRHLFAADENTIVIGGTTTPRCSSDGGQTWSQEACNGVSTPGRVVEGPDGTLYASDLASSSNNILTEVYRSMDNAQSWELISEYCVYATSGAVRPDNRYLYLHGSAGIIGRVDLDLISSTQTPNATIENVTAYPNPTDGILQIELPENATHATIDLYDLQGKHLHRQISNGPIARLDLSALSPGTYLLRVQGDGWLETGRVVRL